MNHTHRSLLAISIALIFAHAAQANDAPKPAADAHGAPAADAHGAPAEAAKPAAPTEPSLPSKPYPKNAAPFKPKGAAEKPVAAVTPPPVAEKADAGHDKHDKPADKVAAAEPHHAAPAKKYNPAAHAAADPALHGVLNDTVKADAHGQSPEREPYVVQARDTLNRVIKKTFPTTPFSIEVMREAFMKANPQALAAGKSARLRPGSALRLPDAGIIRLVVLGEMAPPVVSATANTGGSGYGNGNAHSVGLSQSGSHDAPKIIAVPAPPAAALAAPAAMIEPPAPPIALPRQAVTVASSANPAPEVTSEEKKKWVRFP